MTKEQLAEGPWLSVAKSCEYSGVGKTKLYELMGAGRLPYAQLDRKKRLVSLPALKQLLLDHLHGMPDAGE